MKPKKTKEKPIQPKFKPGDIVVTCTREQSIEDHSKDEDALYNAIGVVRGWSEYTQGYDVDVGDYKAWYREEEISSPKSPAEVFTEILTK